MNKITSVQQKVQKSKGVSDSLSWLHFDDSFFTPEINRQRKALREFLERDVQSLMVDYVEKAEFP